MKHLIDPEGRYFDKINPTIDGMGYNLVRVKQMAGQKTNTTLQIMIERGDGSAVNVDDCTKISRALSALLDVEDPFEEAYDLEVSSTGVPRPLTRLSDFKAYVGREIKSEIYPPVNNRKRFRGILSQANKDTLIITDGEDNFELAYSQLATATPVFNDDLLDFEASRNALPSAESNEQQTSTAS